MDKDDLKQMHINYFLQVQTLINQKAIGSPKETRGPKKEDKPAQKKKPQQTAEKTLIEKICKHCSQPFLLTIQEKRPALIPAGLPFFELLRKNKK